MKDIRKIKKVDKNGNVTKVIEVDWNKLPCSKCERRYHFTCPKDCWNKKENIVYTKLSCALPNSVVYRKDCIYCKHIHCNQECSKCINAEYYEEQDDYICNCLRETTFKASSCPYFRADIGD